MSQKYYPQNSKQANNQTKYKSEEKGSTNMNPEYQNTSYTKQKSNKLSIETNQEEEKACPPKSPLKWICDFGVEKKFASKLSFFNMSKTSNYNSIPLEPTTSNANYNSYSNSNVNYDFRLDYENRKKAADSFLQHIDSDEEMIPPQPNSAIISHELQETIPPSLFNNQTSNSKHSSNNNLTNLVGETPLPYIMISNPMENKIRPIQGEARIVAPNVSKLSPNSAVEIRLQSNKESVTVLCSVDVLKMRSGFFHDILSDQEKNILKSMDPSQIQAHNKSMLNQNLSNSFTSTVSTPNIHTSQNYSSNILWRDPIHIPEATPFDAAAFLESLHEGRALFRGEWNLCWARLSVNWIIEDLITEYANQIEEHMNKLVSIIQNNNWRTNPNVLAGMKVCLFRKGSNSLPTIITGTILETSINIGYSRIRVNFDVEKNNSNPKNGNISVTLANLSTLSPSKLSSILPYPSLSSPNTTLTSAHNGNDNNDTSSNENITQQQYIGDVTEPFWVQNIHKDGAMWCDPDEIFTLEARKYITTTDKRIFWEMARALIELPEISLACKTGIRNIQDLTYALKKPEYRILWTSEAPEMLPKEMATELIRASYLSTFEKPNF